MNTKKQDKDDVELEQILADMSKEGRLIDCIIDLRAEADASNAQNIEINSVALTEPTSQTGR